MFLAPSTARVVRERLDSIWYAPGTRTAPLAGSPLKKRPALAGLS